MKGLYIHVPFCYRRCLYCDFFTVGARLADWDAYVDALLAEAAYKIKFRNEETFPDPDNRTTLYIGGGTPSLIPPAHFRRLSSGVLDLIGQPVEFTIEVNPDDVTETMAEVWKDSGVNRMSMGVQSLMDSELKAIGRRHNAYTALKAFEILRRYFDNISLDIIFGLPRQTLDSLKFSVDGIIKLDPEHISAYSLTYEERSALTRLLEKGIIKEIPEEDTYAMFEYLTSKLRKSGYEQYEISNYAKIKYGAQSSVSRSIHNSLYWKGSPYIGLGPSAHSYDGLRNRSINFPDIKNYISFWSCNKGTKQIEIPDSISESEILSDDELREEMIMTRLRTKEGLDLDEFKGKFGKQVLTSLLKNADNYIKGGKLIIRKNRLSLTHEGIFISDDIISTLF